MSTVVDILTEPTNAATDFLEHYGVKGMRWGQSTRSSGGSTSSSLATKARAVAKPSRPPVKPSKEAKALSKTNSSVKAKKSVKHLSNKELKDALERMRLEQQYSQMTNGLDKTTRQKAAQFVRDLVGPQRDKAANQAFDAYRQDFVAKATKSGRYAPKPSGS
jgi:3-oxoacyl-ACP reductase-like protein